MSKTKTFLVVSGLIGGSVLLIGALGGAHAFGGRHMGWGQGGDHGMMRHMGGGRHYEAHVETRRCQQGWCDYPQRGNRPSRVKRFDRFDLDKNGSVTKDEAISALIKRFEGRIARKVRSFDANGDGKVTKEEFNAPILERFASRDANGDGQLTKDELPRFMGRGGRHGRHMKGHMHGSRIGHGSWRREGMGQGMGHGMGKGPKSQRPVGLFKCEEGWCLLPDGSPASERAGSREDDDLMRAIAAGDQRAAKQVVEHHLPLLMSLARYMLGSEAEAEEIAQEAFLKLWKQADNWESGRALIATWLRRVASNLCIDRLRQRRTTALDPQHEQPVAPTQHARSGRKASGASGQSGAGAIARAAKTGAHLVPLSRDEPKAGV